MREIDATVAAARRVRKTPHNDPGRDVRENALGNAYGLAVPWDGRDV